MPAITFDALEYFEKLKAAGVPDEQARVFADTMRRQNDAQVYGLEKALKDYDESRQKELATKGDLDNVRLEIEKVRSEIKSTELRLLKWQWGIALALAAIMAKGFGWLGF